MIQKNKIFECSFKKTEMSQKDQSMSMTLIDLFLLSLELVKLTNRVKDKTKCCDKG